MPQLLSMFDELARRGNGCDGVVLSSSCSIPTALQKRLSLVPTTHQNSIFNQHILYTSDLASQQNSPKSKEQETKYDKVENNIMLKEKTAMSYSEDENKVELRTEKSICERRENSGLTLFRYNRQRNRNGRPLSNSSIASSTSSSSCSNQGNMCIVNPYLTSVESLADTCASSQGSADSGVVTISEVSCRILSENSHKKDSAEEDSLCHRPRYYDPHRNPVERVLLEIVDTEAIYVEHLRQVIQGYLTFWRNNPPLFAHQLCLGDLFSNIKDIFEFNREFLSEIEKCNLDPVCVANTFIKHNSGFKVYTEYCTNYPRTVSVLTDLMGNEETASAFRERQAALGHDLPLGSFLLKPVQRILKYHLLLENLSKEYGADCDSKDKTEGISAIEAALTAMTGIAKHINAMKKRHEHAVRVQEIQSLLYGWPGPDLTTSGELIAEGRFRMRGAKAPRHAFLFDRMLLLTKKKEDGLLVYKTHIMCSNLMLIESIPGEPLSFHVIPFDNPRLQCTLQARNLEQKREWTLQIKRVMLENYNAVIPSHARKLVLQLGQTEQEDDALTDRGSAKKHSAPPEYLERRKQEKERRRFENGLRQKFKKRIRKSDATIEESPMSSRKTDNEDAVTNDSRNQPFNKSSDIRTSKVKDRFTGWRRKSEPGFQSYICLNYSDEEQKEDLINDGQSTTTEEATEIHTKKKNETVTLNSSPIENNNTDRYVTTKQTVEEIVGHILMENQEFQKLFDKQRASSAISMRQQRFNRRNSINMSDESDSENINYINTSISNTNRLERSRAILREQRLIKLNDSWDSLSSKLTQEDQQSFSVFDNPKTTRNSIEMIARNVKINNVREKRVLFETFDKRQNIVTENKIIKTALGIRENTTSLDNETIFPSPTICKPNYRIVKKNEINSIVTAKQVEKDVLKQKNEEINNISNISNNTSDAESKSFGNYDNLQHVWEELQTVKYIDSNDSPTRPAVWLTKLCEDMPISPLKCGSLPRSFQISPNSQPSVTKSRFLQRDGKPMSERPFTIASDKPAEINLEDMERYASTCQPEDKVAKFPTSTTSLSTSSSIFFSLEDRRLTDDTYSDVRMSVTDSTNIHPDHKIYRANDNGSNNVIQSILFKASNRLQGRPRSTKGYMSMETLECSDELEKNRKNLDSLNTEDKCPKRRTKQAKRCAKELSSNMEEFVGCTTVNVTNNQWIPELCYKQGSSSLGARIAQSDYADPTTLFAESNRVPFSAIEVIRFKQTDKSEEKDRVNEEINKCTEHCESETDSFYEKSFEIIENYANTDVDEAFRDSAIFSDVDEIFMIENQQPSATTITATTMTKTTTVPETVVKIKVAPPIPLRKKQETSLTSARCKPSIAQKPDYLKIKSVLAKEHIGNNLEVKVNARLSVVNVPQSLSVSNTYIERDDISAGQSQAGWVRKIVGQLQGYNGT